jgi:hypothetical protein
MFRFPVSVDSDSSSSGSLDSEITSVWQHGTSCPIKETLKQPELNRAKSASIVICPSGDQNMVLAAEVHCSKGGSKTEAKHT